MKIGIGLIGLAIALVAATAQAQQLDSTHKDWSVLSMQQDGATLCYIASAPVKSTGTFKSRGEAYLLVTRKGKGVDEISASSGYDYRNGSEPVVIIGNKQYRLFVQDDTAWNYDDKQDAQMVQSMKKGSSLTLKGTSRKGTESTDTYSLSGFSAAYNRMHTLCANR